MKALLGVKDMGIPAARAAGVGRRRDGAPGKLGSAGWRSGGTQGSLEALLMYK